MSTITVAPAWENANASIDHKTVADKKASAFSEIYIVSGTSDDMEALRKAYEFAPAKKEGLYKATATIEERATDKTWRVRMEYSEKAKPTGNDDDDDDEAKFISTFSTGGGTQHIETSISTPGAYWDTSVYPDGRPYPGCIEPDIDGNPRGLDIPAPMFKFSETHVFRASKVTTAFKCNLAYATRCMNERPFRGFASGEVLFLGVSGGRDGEDKDDPWTLTYDFAVQKGQHDIVIGDITVPQKFGWDYLWKFIESRTGASGTIYKKVTGVFVERIYDPIDFKILGI